MPITGLAVANVVRDKLPMFVIRKSKNPCCFKSVNFLPRLLQESIKRLHGWSIV